METSITNQNLAQRVYDVQVTFNDFHTFLRNTSLQFGTLQERGNAFSDAVDRLNETNPGLANPYLPIVKQYKEEFGF